MSNLRVPFYVQFYKLPILLFLLLGADMLVKAHT